MTSFIALYRGQSIGAAELVAVSADAEIVGQVAALLLDQPQFGHTEDPIVAGIAAAKRHALEVVRDEAAGSRFTVVEGGA